MRIKYSDKSGLIETNVLKQDEIINKVFVNMINMLEELEKDYSTLTCFLSLPRRSNLT